MLSIQFRSHLWSSPTHRRAAPYVIFILFIVSRSHPTAWVNIFLRDRALSVPYFVSLTSLPRRDIFFFFLETITSYNVCVGRAAFITPEMKLFGIVLSTESRWNAGSCLPHRERYVLKMGSKREAIYLFESCLLNRRFDGVLRVLWEEWSSYALRFWEIFV